MFLIQKDIDNLESIHTFLHKFRGMSGDGYDINELRTSLYAAIEMAGKCKQVDKLLSYAVERHTEPETVDLGNGEIIEELPAE